MILPGDATRAEAMVAHLPMIGAMPAVAERLLRLAADEQTTTQQLAALMARDPGLTALVLRYANSPLYGAREPIRDLVSAIVVLGFRAACEVGVAASFRALDTADASAEAHWRHTLCVATVASRMARDIFANRGGDVTFVSALLHDIGKVALRRARPEIYAECFTRGLSEDAAYALCWHKLGFHPSDVGAALARLWKLAPEIEICAQHHANTNALVAGVVDGEQAMLLWILQGAVAIARETSGELEADCAAAQVAWLTSAIAVAPALKQRYLDAWGRAREAITSALRVRAA